jgi:hypothetical protein
MKRKYLFSAKHVIKWGAAAVLGGFFLISGILKAINFPEFVAATRDFRLLPEAMTLPVAAGIVGCEIVGGILLSMRKKVQLVSSILAILVAIFSAAIGINLFRSNLVPCGCFGGVLEGSISAWYLLRNFCIIVLLIAFHGIHKATVSSRQEQR